MKISSITTNIPKNINFSAKLVEECSGNEEAPSPMLAFAVSRTPNLRSKAETNTPEKMEKYGQFVKFFKTSEGKKMLGDLPQEDELVIEKVYSVKGENNPTPYVSDVFISYNSTNVNDNVEYLINIPGTFERYWNKPAALLEAISGLIRH